MSKVVRISDSAFSRLQKYAEPLVDSPGSVIDRLLDFYESNAQGEKMKASSVRSEDADEITFDTKSPPQMGFADIVYANIDGQTFPKAHWIDLVVAAHRRAFKSAKNSLKLADDTIAPVAVGNKTDQGYSHYPDFELSIQRQDNDGSFRSIVHLAEHYKFPIEIRVRWKKTSKARLAGKTGYTSWSPK